MCKKVFGSGALLALAFVLMAWGAVPALAQPNPTLNGVDCNAVKAGAQSDTADPRWEDNNADFAVNCAGLNPLGWGYDYAHAWVYLDTATNSLYVCIDTYGFPGDADGDGGYASQDPNFCGGWQATCGPVAEDPSFVFGGPEEINLRLDRNCDGFNDLVFRLSSDQLRIDSDSFTPANNGVILGGRGDAWEIAPDQAQGSALFGDPLCDDPRSREGAVLVCIPNFSSYFDVGTGLTEQAFTWRVSGGHADDQFSEDSVTGILNVGDPAIDIIKTANKTELCATGDDVVFSLTVENTGNVSLENVTVTDVLPAGLTYVPPVNGACQFGIPVVAGQTLTWNLGTLAPGDVLTCPIDATSSGCVGTITNNADVRGTVTSPCVLQGGQPFDVTDSDFAEVSCFAPCVDILPVDDQDACPGSALCVTFTVENCGAQTETIDFTGMFNGAAAAAVPAQASVGAGQTVLVEVCGVLPVDCTTVDATLNASIASVPGCEANDSETATINCLTPLISITKDDGIAPDVCVPTNSSVIYTITVENIGPVPVTDIVVTDQVDGLAVYVGGSATPAAASEPANGSTGQVRWEDAGPLAPGGILVYTLEVILNAPDDCDVSITHTNTAGVEAFCEAARALDTASHDTCIECIERGFCWMTMGGHQNGGFKSGPKDDTFGGNVGPPPHGSWQHIQRHGNNILFNFHSHDVNVISCYHDGGDGPCNPKGPFNVIEYGGTGKYSIGTGSREYDAVWTARAEDHGEPGNRPNRRHGGCGSPDYYFIEVRNADTNELVFTADDFLDGGNIQIHPYNGNQERKLDLEPIIGVGDADANLVGGSALYRVYPNPFQGATRIAYAVEAPSGGEVDIAIYDIAGRQVRQLVREVRNAGVYEAAWDGRDALGADVATGMYFVRVVIAGEVAPVSRILKIDR